MVLGKVEAEAKKLTIFHTKPKKEQINIILSENAKKLGADAVINVTYKKGDSCAHKSLAGAIFELSGFIAEVYFFDNYITGSQDGGADWDELEEKIKNTILTKAAEHDPNFEVEQKEGD